MPTSFWISKTLRLKNVTVVGKTSYAELEEQFQLYFRHPNFSPSNRFLVDLTQMTDAVTGLWEISKLKKLYQMAYSDAENMIDVCIVPGSLLSWNVAKAFSILMLDKRPMNIQVCSSVEDALGRLRISPEEYSKAKVEAAREKTVLKVVTEEP